MSDSSEVGIPRLGNLGRQTDAGVHAGDLPHERLQVGRFGISLFDGLGHRAVINHVAVAVEQVSVPGQPLVKGIDRRQRRFILDDEAQLFAADTVIFGRVLLYQCLAVFLGQRCLANCEAMLSSRCAPETKAW